MIPRSTSPEGECYGQDYEQLPSIHLSLTHTETFASTVLETTPSAHVHNMAAMFFVVFPGIPDTVEQ